MTLHLELPPELERALCERAAAAGKPIDAFVAEAVAEKLAEVTQPPARTVAALPATHEEFVARLRRASSRHHGPGAALDDSRESIYAGRGE